MVYLAGLDIHDLLRKLPLSHSQGVEGLVWLTTFAGVYRGFRSHSKTHRRLHGKHGSETGVSAPHADAGNIGERPPVPLLVKLLSPVVHVAIVITPAVYLVGTAYYRLEQPEWFSNWSLPDAGLTVGKFAALRTVACVANYGVLYLLKRVKQQIHVAAAAEKPTIPEEGPYSVVRHPMAAATVLGQVSYALMWWNSIPLAAAALSLLYLTVQIPHEEYVTEADLIKGPQYIEYKKKVTSRLIPYIW